MTYHDLYNNVVAQLGVDKVQHDDFYYWDVIRAIHRAALEVRQEYFIQGLFSQFAMTKKLDGFEDDDNYNFLRVATLNNTPLHKTLPPQQSVLTTYIALTSNEIVTQIESWDRDEIARIGEDLYRTVSDIDSLNSYDKRFDGERLRHFKSKNGAKFFSGDAFYDNDTDHFYRVESEFVNDTDSVAELENQGTITTVYWMKVGKAFVQANLVNMSQIAVLRYIDKNDAVPIAIERDRVFLPKDTGEELVITFIPELVWPEDTNVTLYLPEFALSRVVESAVMKMMSALGFLNQRAERETDEQSTTQ